MACSHRRCDETRQCCLVSNCVHTTNKTVLSRPSFDESTVAVWTQLETRQNCLVLSSWRCEHNCRQDKTVLSGLQLCSHRQLDKTREFCLVRVGGVRKPQRSELRTWSNTAQRKCCLAEEVWIAKHVHILHDKPEQRHRRIDDIKLARLWPDRVETVIHWNTHRTLCCQH